MCILALHMLYIYIYTCVLGVHTGGNCWLPLAPFGFLLAPFESLWIRFRYLLAPFGYPFGFFSVTSGYLLVPFRFPFGSTRKPQSAQVDSMCGGFAWDFRNCLLATSQHVQQVTKEYPNSAKKWQEVFKIAKSANKVTNCWNKLYTNIYIYIYIYVCKLHFRRIPCETATHDIYIYIHTYVYLCFWSPGGGAKLVWYFYFIYSLCTHDIYIYIYIWYMVPDTHTGSSKGRWSCAAAQTKRLDRPREPNMQLRIVFFISYQTKLASNMYIYMSIQLLGSSTTIVSLIGKGRA